MILSPISKQLGKLKKYKNRSLCWNVLIKDSYSSPAVITFSSFIRKIAAITRFIIIIVDLLRHHCFDVWQDTFDFLICQVNLVGCKLFRTDNRSWNLAELPYRFIAFFIFLIGLSDLNKINFVGVNGFGQRGWFRIWLKF